MHHKPFFVFDVETPNCANDRISAIAFSLVRDEQIIETKSYLVNPETNFDDFNSRLTGIYPNMVKDAPTFPEIWDEIYKHAKDAIWVAHNASFDLNVLRKTLSIYNVHLDNVHYIDTLGLSKSVFPYMKNHQLNTLCHELNISLEHHKADSDSKACAELFLRLQHAGLDVMDRVRTFSFLKEDHYRPSHHGAFQYNQETLALRELNSFLDSVVDDGVLTEENVYQLFDWMSDHADLLDKHPFDKISVALQNALADGILEKSELDELLELFQTVSDPVAHMQKCSTPIYIKGKTVCLTGEFESMRRADAEKKVQEYGAILKKSVIKSLDYLVVGGMGSNAWSAGKYGSKIKTALENQKNGLSVQIIRESEFFSCLTDKAPEDEQICLSINVEATEPPIKTLADKCYSEMQSCLSDEKYDVLPVKLVYREPAKSDPYYAIEIFGQTCIRFEGKVQIKMRILPSVVNYLQSFEFVPTKNKDRKAWRAIRISQKTNFKEMYTAFVEMYEYCSVSRADCFDCCSRFEQCCNARECIHPDKQFASSCRYRQKLRKGIVFGV